MIQDDNKTYIVRGYFPNNSYKEDFVITEDFTETYEELLQAAHSALRLIRGSGFTENSKTLVQLNKQSRMQRA